MYMVKKYKQKHRHTVSSRNSTAWKFRMLNNLCTWRKCNRTKQVWHEISASINPLAGGVFPVFGQLRWRALQAIFMRLIGQENRKGEEKILESSERKGSKNALHDWLVSEKSRTELFSVWCTWLRLIYIENRN